MSDERLAVVEQKESELRERLAKVEGAVKTLGNKHDEMAQAVLEIHHTNVDQTRLIEEMGEKIPTLDQLLDAQETRDAKRLMEASKRVVGAIITGLAAWATAEFTGFLDWVLGPK